MKTQINEIFFLRAVACLGIVLMHSAEFALHSYENVEGLTNASLKTLQIVLMFCTPTFIFISEFVISYSYPINTPESFLKKRFKFIFLPFLFTGLFDAMIATIIDGFDFISFIKKIISHLFLGYFHGYFILIIFQFYILHLFFYKVIVSRYSAKKVIITSLLINVCYLSIFNFIVPNFNVTPLTLIVTEYLNKIPFLAWIFYFVVAYYCGTNYEKFIKKIKRYSKQIIFATFMSLGVLMVSHLSGFLTFDHSKRVDVILYTISLTFLLFFIANKITSMPKWIILVSRYSFGIYLLHPFINTFIKVYLLESFTKTNILFFIVLTFVSGILGSILITFLLNKHKFGKYIVGRVGTIRKGKRIENSSFLRNSDINA